MNAAILDRIDSIVKNGIQERAFPGCQVYILKDGEPVYDKCFGTYTYETTQKVNHNTMYDLASLTKTTGTLLAIMKLYDEGELKLTDKASDYLDFLRGTDKESITITELLFHESGLPGTLPFHRLVIEKKDSPSALSSSKDPMHNILLNSKSYKYNDNLVSKIPSEEYPIQVSDSFYLHKSIHKAAMEMIAHTHLGSKTYLYSCVNFILLKEIAEKISCMPLDVFLNLKFYSPMNLNHIAYLPLRTHKIEDIAPTLKKDYLRNGVIQGYVHDPAAAFLGGISGNAGLFATAKDVATVYQMLLNKGELDGKRYLSQETCNLFTVTTSASGRRGLGFDKPVPAHPKWNPCCVSAPQAVYGHTGYTGTCCWVDPVNNLVYVFLSNRTYPNDAVNKLARMSIRPKIQEIMYQAILEH
jgi:CubicO group peptidase (beta-lactamase class C family)